MTPKGILCSNSSFPYGLASIVAAGSFHAAQVSGSDWSSLCEPMNGGYKILIMTCTE